MCCQNVELQGKLIDKGVIWSLKAFLELLCEARWRLGEQQVHRIHAPQNDGGRNISFGVTPIMTFWALLLLQLLLSYSRTPHLSGSLSSIAAPSGY